MHLVVTTPHFPPESGGPATYAKILAENFPAQGVRVTIVRFAKVRPFPKLLRPLLFFLLVLRHAMRADVILALDPVSTGMPAALAALLLNKPLVAKIVGDCAWEQGRARYGIAASLDDFVRIKRVPVRVRMYRTVQNWVAARARRIIVPSNYLKRIVTAWGVPEGKIEVIYNSVELGPAGSVPPAISHISGFKAVTIARLVRWKHIDSVIDAIKQIPDASLIVVGDGPERAELESRARDEPRIVFTGELPNAQTLAIAGNADVLVLNSSYEGMSHVLIEALMLGLPIIATRAGGNEEVLPDGSAILIAIDDGNALTASIRQVKDDARLRDRLSRAALTRSRVFTKEAMLQSTKSALTSLL